MRIPSALVLSGLAMMILAHSCSKDDGGVDPSDSEPVNHSNSGPVGAAGGTVTLNDPGSPGNGAFVSIPEGALEEDVVVSIAVETDVVIPGDSSAIVVRFEPSGLAFSEPVEIGIPFNGSITERFGVWNYQEDSSKFVQLPIVAIDQENLIAVATTDHFSFYQAGSTGVFADIEMGKINGRMIVNATIDGRVSGSSGLSGVPLTFWTYIQYPIYSDARDLVLNFDNGHLPGVLSVFTFRLMRGRFFSDEEVEVKRVIVGRFFDAGLRGLRVYSGGPVFDINDYEEQYRIEYLWNDDTYEEWFRGDRICCTFDYEFNSGDRNGYYIMLDWCVGLRPSNANGRLYTPFYVFNNSQEAAEFSNLFTRAIDVDENDVIDQYQPQNTAPTASFTVSPSSGTTATSFQVNAGGSSDAESPTSQLEVRWDWENNGSYDTGWTTTKTASHQYTSSGNYTIKLQVRDPQGMTAETTRSVSVGLSNTAPTASFTVTPSSGTTATTFQVNASGSSDAESPTSQLEVRWDWENNGNYDTGWTTMKTASHQYSSNGNYTIRLQVRDPQGLTAETTRAVSVGSSNTTPTASFTVSPTSGTTATTFQVDASGSSDAESLTSQLEVRWDWENNGNYDTGWTTTKTASHQYSSIGSYSIKLQVRDPEGLTAETTRSVTVSSGGGGSGPPTMITVPAGQFMMGQAGVATPEHNVTLTRSFDLSQTEITNQQYVEALQWAYDNSGLTGVSATTSTVQAYGVELLDLNAAACEISFSGGQFVVDTGREQHPVVEVSWYGAACFCDWMSVMDSLPPFYNGLWNQTPSPNNPYEATGYRLPTEAEWEYAAQFDNERTYPWGNTSPTLCVHASYNNCVSRTAPVGSYPAGDSLLDLKDLAGNVWEWCNDWYAGYSAGAVSDPPGPSTGTYRVGRGGSWSSSGSTLRCAERGSNTQSYTTSYIGFRLCRTLY